MSASMLLRWHSHRARGRRALAGWGSLRRQVLHNAMRRPWPIQSTAGAASTATPAQTKGVRSGSAAVASVQCKPASVMRTSGKSACNTCQRIQRQRRRSGNNAPGHRARRPAASVWWHSCGRALTRPRCAALSALARCMQRPPPSRRRRSRHRAREAHGRGLSRRVRGGWQLTRAGDTAKWPPVTAKLSQLSACLRGCATTARRRVARMPLALRAAGAKPTCALPAAIPRTAQPTLRPSQLFVSAALTFAAAGTGPRPQ